MTEQPDPKPFPDPRRPDKPHKRRTPKPGDLLGYGLLAVGLAVILGLAAVTFTRHTQPLAPAIQTPAPQTPTQSPPMALGSLSGEWTTSQGPAIASLSFSGTVFHLTFVADDKGDIRRYARGRFIYDEARGILTLKPDGRLSEPKPIPGVIYKIMTLEPFDIVLFRGPDTTPGEVREMIWQAPADKIATRQIHPLFHYMMKSEQPELLWHRIEKTQEPTDAGATRSRNR